jgi:hypothetical protein
VIHSSLASADSGVSPAPAQMRWWHRLALICFACVNVAAIGIFFAVFVGVVMSPPNPRNLLFFLVAGGVAFAVLALGQFFYWSRLALGRLKGRRP